jgi:ADP-ribose pyrophosphatase YjhB (NUDIX family)
LSLDLLDDAFLIRNGLCWTWSLRGGRLHVGGSSASDIQHVLQREPRIGTTWVLVGSILPNEEHVDVAVHDLHEETGLILTFDDFTLLSDALARVALPEGQRQVVYVLLAFVLVPYVTDNLRTRDHLEQVVSAPSTINNRDGSYVAHRQLLALMVFL